MSRKRGAIFRRIKTLPVDLFWRWPKAAVRASWQGLRNGIRNSWRGLCWLSRELRYRSTLLLSLSRIWMTLDGFVAFVAIFILMGMLFTRGVPVGGRDILDLWYRLVTLLMILFGMNLLPRERERRTLELLWSQPISRAGLVLMQLLATVFWLGVMLGCVLVIYGSFKSTQLYSGYVMFLSLSTGLGVGLITVLISTFCRQGIATGIVAVLLIGAHYVWFPQVGPIAMFFNPLPAPTDIGAKISVGPIIANRIFMLILLAFVFDYLVRRLRRTARWFT